MTDGTAADLVARVRQVAEADARRQQRTHIEHNGATIAKYLVDGVPYYMAWRGMVLLRHEPFASADEARAFIGGDPVVEKKLAPPPPAVGFYVELTPAEQQTAVDVGKAWTASNRASNGKNKQVDLRITNEEANANGILGEIAFAKAYGLKPRLDVCINVGRPDAIYNGERVDVKATRLPEGRLMLYKPRPGDRNTYQNIDVFYLARLHLLPYVHIVGWAYKRHLMRPECIESYKHYGPTYFLPTRNRPPPDHNELHPALPLRA